MKKLIINADEFGLTQGANRAIIESYLFGTVSSTTMIVNMWAFREAVHLAKENPGLGIGIHLNLTDGRPVLPAEEVKSLVNSDGSFYSRRDLIIRLLSHKVNPEEIKRELNAQVEKLTTSGIYPLHIDTHQSIILLPSLFWIVKDLAKSLKVPLLLPVDARNPISLERTSWIKWSYAYFMGWRYRRILKIEGILAPDSFYNVVNYFTDRYWDEKRLLCEYKKVISSIKEDTSQFMVHPSYICNNLTSFMIGSEMMARQREEELKVLLNLELKSFIQNSGFRLATYAEIME
ncbi:MAG: ChbG/HpnK family deacetylase [Candidatus Brocadiaceae bacterium]|nr:ChbG/HpnK family deacetylase [Candidatus Brocadiaceae bacterium]